MAEPGFAQQSAVGLESSAAPKAQVALVAPHRATDFEPAVAPVQLALAIQNHRHRPRPHHRHSSIDRQLAASFVNQGA